MVFDVDGSFGVAEAQLGAKQSGRILANGSLMLYFALIRTETPDRKEPWNCIPYSKLHDVWQVLVAGLGGIQVTCSPGGPA